MTDTIPTSRRRSKLLFRVNALAAVSLAAMLAVMLNYISARHAWRWDVSRGRIHSISDNTKRVLDQLQSGVDITVCFRSESGLARKLLNLLTEYESYSRRIKVLFIYPDRDLAAARELERKHKLTEPDVVVVSAGAAGACFAPGILFQARRGRARRAQAEPVSGRAGAVFRDLRRDPDESARGLYAQGSRRAGCG